jgi:hypothetical protein
VLRSCSRSWILHGPCMLAKARCEQDWAYACAQLKCGVRRQLLGMSCGLVCLILCPITRPIFKGVCACQQYCVHVLCIFVAIVSVKHRRAGIDQSFQIAKDAIACSFCMQRRQVTCAAICQWGAHMLWACNLQGRFSACHMFAVAAPTYAFIWYIQYAAVLLLMLAW